MTTMTFCYARCIGNQANCYYPYQAQVTDDASLRHAVCHDYVTAEYRDNYRSNDHFLRSDTLALDIDNDHTENEADWMTPEKLCDIFGGVTLAFHFSRNHLRRKDKYSPRPRFHVFLAIDPCEDAETYVSMKKRLSRLYSFFDPKALDAARFFYGTSDPQVKFVQGTRTLNAWLAEQDAEMERQAAAASEAQAVIPESGSGPVIPEGSRNATLSHFAAIVLTRYGATEQARTLFREKAALCQPPLPDRELNTIWRSAEKFYCNVVSRRPDYIPPEQFAARERERQGSTLLYCPSDESDVAEARMLAEVFGERLRYSLSTNFLIFDGRRWLENRTWAHTLMHDFSDMQLQEAEAAAKKAWNKLAESGGSDLIAQYGKNKAGDHMSDDQQRLLNDWVRAEQYKMLAMRYRQSKNIVSVLTEVQPMVYIEPDQLDRDGFLLNTPAGVYDLRKGLNGLMPHDPKYYMTHLTAVSPGREGEDLWRKALDLYFQHDQELIDYVQLVAGVILIGQVQREELLIAYGCGRNGKSSFWNTLAAVMGSYAGSLSADVLTAGCKRNVKPELAELKGKRLIIAAELEEGMRVNGSIVKQLCSTDRIVGEKKYRDPFAFIPSHSVVLYTNHLPKVGSLDDGIWRRLVVIPFNAKIEGKGEKKNFARELREKAGGAVLAWMIEGAERIIRADFQLDYPACVKQAMQTYRESNHWLNLYLEERCLVEPTLHEQSGKLFDDYQLYCKRSGDYCRSKGDFYAALEAAGFTRRKTRACKIIDGLLLKPWPDEDYEYPDRQISLHQNPAPAV